MYIAAFVSVTTAAFVYLCTNPQVVANEALDAYFRRRTVQALVLSKLYESFSGIYALIFRRYAESSIHELARFQFGNHRDAQDLRQIQQVIDQIRTLQTTAVSSDQSFEELRKAAPAFSSWHDLGFQQENPATDFRGAGQWGLNMFTHFCSTKDCARLVIESGSSSSKLAGDKPWYPLALVSIRLSMTLCELLKSEKLLVFRILQLDKDWLTYCRQLHCQLLIQFHESWMSARRHGKVQNYFDNELILKEFDDEFGVKLYYILTA